MRTVPVGTSQQGIFVTDARVTVRTPIGKNKDVRAKHNL